MKTVYKAIHSTRPIMHGQLSVANVWPVNQQRSENALRAIAASHPITHQAIALVKEGANHSAKLKIAEAIAILANALAELPN